MPVFENRTMEANVEVAVTNAVLTEMYKSKEVEITPYRKEADAVLIGTVTKFTNSQVARTLLPVNRDLTLTREYLVDVHVHAKLVRISDSKVLFEGDFFDTKRYLANPGGRGDITQNEDRQRLAIVNVSDSIAEDLHDALTWDF